MKHAEYCNRLLDLVNDSEEGIDSKVYFSWVMFDVSISIRDEKNARSTMDKLSLYSNNDNAQRSAKEMQSIIKEEFVIRNKGV